MEHLGLYLKSENPSLGESFLKHKFIVDDSILSVWTRERTNTKPKNALVTIKYSIFKVFPQVKEHSSYKTLYSQKLEGSDLCIKDQPIGAIGSALAISPRLILTAGHLFNETCGLPYKRIVFVSNFGREDQLEFYRCNKILDHKILPHLDYAIVELDNPLNTKFHQITTRKEPIKPGTAVYVCGNANGMPLTRGDFTVKSVNEGTFTLAGTGTWLRLSGGVVFNSETYTVEGIITDITDESDLKCLDISAIPLPKLY